jgi:hypothetical protein
VDSLISIWACSLNARVPQNRQIGIALPLAVMNRIRRQNVGSARVLQNLSITQCDAVCKLTGIWPVADGPG